MKKILVVDNHPVILKFMENLLGKKGYHVRTAEDGLSALELLKTYFPDICFIDLVMQNISGDRLCRIIRNSRKHKKTYIVIISGIAVEEGDHFKSYGADLYIAKGPFNVMAEHILKVLDALERSEMDLLKGKILGRENLYSREITKELLYSKKHYEITLDYMSEGFLELFFNLKIIFANPAAASIIGIPEEKLLSASFIDLFDESEGVWIKNFIDSAVRKKTSVIIDEPVRLGDKLVSIKIIPVNETENNSILIILGDLSKQKQLEYQLHHAKKMEAIGTLAGGVAHDLNNVLSGIVSYPDLLLRQIPGDSPFWKPLMAIKSSGEKAATIVQDLLTLARRGTATMEAVNLNDIVSSYFQSPEYVKLKSFHTNVDIKFRPDKNLMNTMGSFVHLSKAVMNLISNAVEAIPDKGNVVVTTENRYIDTPVRGIGKMREGEYVALTIADDGEGISQEDQERIFEPFFTKKALGRSGTGLGMAVVWGTIKDHNGFIDVHSDSEVQNGTVITIYLPATRQDIKKLTDPVSIEAYQGNNESILVVDDVREQREIATTMLASLGYNVTAVSGGEEAIEFLKNRKADLIILDMIMNPGMDGLDTYKRIIRIHPGQKAIIVSGFSQTDRIRETRQLGAGPYLKKPYTLEQIGQAVRNELKQK